jgi:hypothetical protein
MPDPQALRARQGERDLKVADTDDDEVACLGCDAEAEVAPDCRAEKKEQVRGSGGQKEVHGEEMMMNQWMIVRSRERAVH